MSIKTDAFSWFTAENQEFFQWLLVLFKSAVSAVRRIYGQPLNDLPSEEIRF